MKKLPALVWEPNDADVTNIKTAIMQTMIDEFGQPKAIEMAKRMSSGKVKTPLHQDEDKRWGDGQHW